MCGIYGRISFRGEPDGGEGLRRLSLLAHRGPDHQGHYSESGVFLGHVRLSIIDPDPAAHQPFGAAQGGPFGGGSARLVYNGEVYNFLGLRGEFQDAEWRTRSDTEVVFRFLRTHGEACLPRFNGMFALAYWDGEKKSLLLARDRAGIKPLYYRADESGFEFASEIKAFGQKPGHFEALKEVLARGYVGTDLPFPDVKELEPGHQLRVDQVSGKWESHPFAPLQGMVDSERMREFQDPATWEGELERRLEASVDLHLQSDAPLAALCSGGIDSSLLSALAHRRRNLPLYHCGVEGRGGEEHFAQAVARHLKTELIVERMRPEDYWELLPEVTWHLDLPVYFQNDVGLHLIARRAHRDGIKVLWCGEGSDELFGGYTWHQDLHRLLLGRKRLRSLGPFAERAWKKTRSLLDFWLGRPHFTPEETTRFAAFGLCYPAPGIDRIYKGYALASEDFRAWKRWDESLRAYAGHAPADEVPVQALLLDNLRGHLRSILHRTDRVLMANSIEGRVPFLENSLMEFALNLPLQAKIRGRKGKALLKAVARRHLPASIIDRPKMGFPVPWERYLPEHPRILTDGFVSEWTRLTPEQISAFHGGDPALRFRLIAIEVWGRIFAFGEKPASIRVH